MPNVDERTIALAYDEAEAMLHSGMLDQNVIGTLASRGLDWGTAKRIVTDLNGSQAERPRRKYKKHDPAARQLAIDLMVRGTALIVLGIVLFLIGNQVKTDFPVVIVIISLAPMFAGVMQFSNGFISLLMGEAPIKNRSRRYRFRLW